LKSDPIGALSNSGNVILSRFPLRNASSFIYKATTGWQSIVPNGALHATTELPSGEFLHLFSTHLQCTTAPPDSASSVDVMNARFAQLLALVEGRGIESESVRTRQLIELKAFMCRTLTPHDKWLLAGDMNIEGGSAEYRHMVDLLGGESLGAPDFCATYNTESFLTPPGWRGVEYR